MYHHYTYTTKFMGLVGFNFFENPKSSSKCKTKPLLLRIVLLVCGLKFSILIVTVVDPGFELRREPGSTLLAQPAFLPSAISSFFTQNKRGGGGGLP